MKTQMLTKKQRSSSSSSSGTAEKEQSLPSTTTKQSRKQKEAAAPLPKSTKTLLAGTLPPALLPQETSSIEDVENVSLHRDSTMETTNNANTQMIDDADIAEAAEIVSPTKEKEVPDDASATPSELEQAAAATFSPVKENKKRQVVVDEENDSDPEPAVENVVDSSLIEAELQQQEQVSSPAKNSSSIPEPLLTTPPHKPSNNSSKPNDADSEVEVRFFSSDEEDEESEEEDSDDATQPETPEKFDDEDFQNDDQDGLQLRGSPSPRKKSIKVNLEDVELGKAQNEKKKSKRQPSKSASKKTKKGNKHSQTKSSKHGKSKSKTTKQKKQTPRNRRRFRCKIVVCCILSLFLMACIAILGYTLYSVRNDQEPSFFGIDITQKFQEWFNRENNSGSSNDNTSSNTPPKPSHTADPELMAMVLESLRSATAAAPLPAGVGDFNVILDQPKSLQYAVVAWLANDPFLFDYSTQKILQRYVLGCFYWSLQDLDMDAKMLDTWMTYEDECFMWHTTNTDMPFCDANGNVVSIHLENVGLKGVLAPELALLSNSLGKRDANDAHFVFLQRRKRSQYVSKTSQR